VPPYKHIQRCAVGIPNEIPGIGIPRYSIGIPTGPRYFKDRGYRGYINTYIKRTNNVQGNWYRESGMHRGICIGKGCQREMRREREREKEREREW